MKKFKVLLISFIFVVCGNTSAANWYAGISSGYYGLGKSDHWAGEVELGQMGFQAGGYFNDDVSLEMGYSNNFNSDGFSILSLSALFWLGEYSSKYRPYFLLGHNSYDVDKQGENPADYNASQMMIGGGFGTKIGDNLQFRAEGRYMLRKSVNEDDLGIQFSINRFFD